jgi:malonyl-ACP O-methyltransferase BioC
MSTHSFDKKIIEENFSRGAKNYELLAKVQKSTATRLCKLAKNFIKENSKILDLGSGTSFIAKNFCADEKICAKNFYLTELDISAEMLKSWTARPKNITTIQGDFEKLPFSKNSFDILISSFSLQWLSDFEKNFSKFFEILKSGGSLIIALPTKNSLFEIKSARIFETIDFPRADLLKLAAKKSGFAEVFFEQETKFEEFSKASECLKTVSKIGGGYSENNPKKLSKSALKKLDEFCLENFSNKNKKTVISWSISYFIFTKNHA